MEVLGGFMNRTMRQLPIENKMNLDAAEATLENMPEFLFF